MMRLNWLLAAVVIILIWNIVSGYRKGLLRVLYRFVSTILAILISVILVMGLSETIREELAVYEALEHAIEQGVSSIETGNALADLILGEETVINGVAEALSTAIFDILLFAVIFIIVRILLGLVNRILQLASDVPVLGMLNRLSGAAAGFLNGMVVVWFLLLFCDLISGTSLGESAASCISGSNVLSAMHSRNVIWSVLKEFVI